VPLRLFLGITFLYAGIQKLSDPGYLHPGAPTYIGTQLRGFAHGTPGGFLLRAFAIPHPKLAGVGVALLEIAVGLLVTTGLHTRAAASVGLALNLILFLTNSWHTSPYFLGSDIVFVFAWLPFVLTGASGQPALDHQIERWSARGAPWSRAGRAVAARWETDIAHSRGVAAAPRRRSGAQPALTRRGVLAQALGLTGLATIVIGGFSALAKGTYRGGGALAGGTPSSAHSSGSSAAGSTKAAGQSSKGSAPAGAVRIGSSSDLPSGQGATYTDPADGQPDIVVRDSSGQVHAFSAICTHAGCTVQYRSGEIVCPCHGGIYNAKTGAVESGPPPQGLVARKVVERAGSLYAVPS
jgi:thiosulfate dehydrogenase (quinone) large subunit